MAFNSLSEALKSPEFEKLSPDAKKYVFDKYSANDSAYKSLSEDAKAHVQQKYLGTAPAAQEEEAPRGPVSGKAAAQRKTADELKQAFSYDPSKAGQVSLAEGLGEVGVGAASGAAIGGGLGAIAGGVGAVPGAILGGITGASGALLGVLAKQAGLGEGYQFAANVVGGAGVEGLATKALSSTLSSSVESLIAQKAASTVGSTVFGVPKPLTNMATKFIESQKSVDTAAARKVLGAEAEGMPTLIGDEANTVRQEIGRKFEQATGTKIPAGVNAEEHIYDTASSAITKATQGESFVGSSAFNSAASIDGKVIPANAAKYKSIFEDANGNALPGQDVINNLRAFKYGEDLPKSAGALAKDRRFQEGEQLEKYFNGWLQNKTGSPWQADARAVFEKVSAANAKDTLPGLFSDVVSATSNTDLKAAANALESQLWNLSKTPEGKKQFLSQFVNNLDNISIKDAKVLWKEIGPEIQKRIITDPTKFKEIDAIINGAKLPKDLTRASRIMKKIIPALGAAEITTGISPQ